MSVNREDICQLHNEFTKCAILFTNNWSSCLVPKIDGISINGQILNKYICGAFVKFECEFDKCLFGLPDLHK